MNLNVTSIIKVSNQCPGFTRSLNSYKSALKIIIFIRKLLGTYRTRNNNQFLSCIACSKGQHPYITIVHSYSCIPYINNNVSQIIPGTTQPPITVKHMEHQAVHHPTTLNHKRIFVYQHKFKTSRYVT